MVPPRPQHGQVCVAPGVPGLLLPKAVATMASAVFGAIFPLIAANQLTPRQNGLLMSFVGVSVAAAQAVLVKPLAARLGEPLAVLACCFAMAAGFAALAVAPGVAGFCLALAPTIAAGTAFATINTAMLTKAVPGRLSGSIVSVDMSIGSGLRMLAPMAGTAALEAHGYPAVCLAAGLSMLALGMGMAVARQPAARRLQAL